MLPSWLRTGTDTEFYYEGLESFLGGCVNGLSEDIEGCLNASDIRPAIRTMNRLRSKSISYTNTILKAYRKIKSGEGGYWAC